MAAWSRMVDVGLSDEEQLESSEPIHLEAPKYPYGLRLSLDEKTLAKLGIDDERDGLPDVGDYVDLRAFACVTSASREQLGDGTIRRRIELQIERLAIENEDDEESDAEGYE